MKNIRVEIKTGESGLIFATSPDLKGLLVAEGSIEELERAIPESIAALSLAAGVPAPSYTIEAILRPSKDELKPAVD